MAKRKEEKDLIILNELFRRSYAASNPPGDFDKLMESAELNEFGQKIIPFMDYECDLQKMEEIFDDVMNEYKVPKWKIKAFSFHFWLGCSPKTRSEE
jgi:hypothetical protein